MFRYYKTDAPNAEEQRVSRRTKLLREVTEADTQRESLAKLREVVREEAVQPPARVWAREEAA